MVTIGEEKFCAGIVVDELIVGELVEEVLVVVALPQPVKMTAMATKKQTRKLKLTSLYFDP